MRRRVALVGSIGIHVACGLALITVRSPDKPREATKLPPVEVVESAHIIEIVQFDSGGGGSRGSKASADAADHVARIDRPTHRPLVRATPTDNTVSDASPTERSLSEIADVSQDDGGEGGEGGGRGGGYGRGVGRGVGTGLGDLASRIERIPAPPVAPKASKARPAKLIYPTRQRSVSEGELFTARVTIDSEGYVVGARVASHGNPKETDASAMIFRFRYAPALDDEGRPIRSTVEQPFLVQ